MCSFISEEHQELIRKSIESDIKVIVKWLKFHKMTQRNATYADCVALLGDHNDGARLARVLEDNFDVIISKLQF